MKIYECENILIKIGQNAKENTHLVQESNVNYVWIHLQSFASGHVIIECEEPSKTVLACGMKLCLDGTKQKNMKNVKASVTTVSNLKCTNILGEVEFKSNRKVKSFKII